MIKCIACGENLSTDPALRVTSEQAAQHFILREYDEGGHRELKAHIERLWLGDVCCIYECSSCLMGFANPYIAGDHAFYRRVHLNEIYPKEKWEFFRTIDELRSQTDPFRSCLEVGSGAGHFLRKIVPNFFAPSSVFALEYNPDAIASISSLDVKCLQKGLLELTDRDIPLPIDVIFMFQVLEHLDRLDEVFAALRNLGNPRMSIIGAVPDARVVKIQEGSGSIIDMPPNHIGRWSKSALACLAERHGFALSKFETEPMNIPIFIRQDLLYSFSRKAQEGGNYASRTRAMRRGVGRKLAQGIALAFFSTSRFMHLAQVITRRSCGGGSVWFRLDSKM